MKYCLLLAMLCSNLLLAIDHGPEQVLFKRIHGYIKDNNSRSLPGFLSQHKHRYDIRSLLNETDDEGLTLLMYALLSERPNLSLVKTLLVFGADPNVELRSDINRYEYNQGNFYAGWTAAHIAVSIGLSRKFLELLYDYDCDFTLVDKGGFTPLEIAFRKMRGDALICLRDLGIDFGGTDKSNAGIKKDEESAQWNWVFSEQDEWILFAELKNLIDTHKAIKKYHKKRRYYRDNYYYYRY